MPGGAATCSSSSVSVSRLSVIGGSMWRKARAPTGNSRIGAPSRVSTTQISSAALLPPRKYTHCASRPSGTRYRNGGSKATYSSRPRPSNGRIACRKRGSGRTPSSDHGDIHGRPLGGGDGARRHGGNRGQVDSGQSDSVEDDVRQPAAGAGGARTCSRVRNRVRNIPATPCVKHFRMDPLAGWTVAVTAERRARELVDLLQRRGATVLLVPTVRAERVDDATLRSATAAVVDRPPDLWVASTAAGVQGWIATAWSWGLGPALTETLRRAAVVARGVSTAGALVGEGFDVDWRAGADTLS